MDLGRTLKHLVTTEWSVRRVFPRRALEAIERAIRDSESSHAGQIRFAVEDSLDLVQLLAGQSARERALEVFSALRVWDTEHNNGVLIYLLLADRDVEIVADRGIHPRVGQEGWESIARAMEAAFREGDFEGGVKRGIEAVSAHLQRHFPREGARVDELPDRPAVL
jgi:uncharacterized membrane protein YgcG